MGDEEDVFQGRTTHRRRDGDVFTAGGSSGYRGCWHRRPSSALTRRPLVMARFM